MPDRTDAERIAYWKTRALSEQARSEEAEAEVVFLRKRQEATATRAKLAEHIAVLKSQGVDLTVGEWKPDDTQECFVRADRPVADPPVH